MKKIMKITMIAAAFALTAGIILAFSAFLFTGFRPTKLSAETFSSVTYQVEQPFDRITVSGTFLDVAVRRSTNGACYVEADESQRIKTEVSVENGELTVSVVDGRKWYQHVGIFFTDHKRVVLYLPAASYGALTVTNASGDVVIGGNLSFGAVEVRTKSGDAELLSFTAESLTATAESGDVDLNGTTVSGRTEIRTESGEVDLNACDSGSYFIKTKSGDVEGRLRSAKNFSHYTKSGEVRMPRPDSTAGDCRIETRSGDIEIRVG